MACGPLNKSPTSGDLLVPDQSPTGLSRGGSKMSMKDSGREKTGSGQRRGADAAQEESDGRTPRPASSAGLQKPRPLSCWKSLSFSNTFFVFKLEISLLNI